MFQSTRRTTFRSVTLLVSARVNLGFGGCGFARARDGGTQEAGPHLMAGL